MASRANDGQSLWDQDSATQNMFIHAAGGDENAANDRWVREHNAQLGNSGNSAASSTGSSQEDQWKKDILDAWKKSSGFDVTKENNLVDYQNRSLKQNQRQFDATLAYKLKTLKMDRDRLALDVGTQAANKWYQEQQVRLADQTHQLAVSQLGLDYLKEDTTLRSTPRNWAQLADFEAGASARQDVPIAFQNLLAGVQGRAYGPMGAPPINGGAANSIASMGGGQGTAAPTAYQTTIPDLQAASASTVGSSGTQGWSGQDVAALNAISKAYQAGGQKIAPGAWEAMPTDAKDMFLGGVDRLGGSSRSWLESLIKSRPGQGSALAA